MKDWNSFFGTKLNSVLLLILIILMIFAIKIMLYNKATYLPFLDSKTEQGKPVEEMDRSKIQGNKDDLVSFSIWPDAKVHGIVSYRGVIKGGYFFEANIGINVLDLNKKVLKNDHGTATGEWMTGAPESFEGNIDFSGLPKGPAYFEIHNDNASGLPEHDKSILIPIVIE
ncbi:MAG: Gmad2 immunoglobulin-like domain-containing protein [Patescibacteria group bacterium]